MRTVHAESPEYAGLGQCIAEWQDIHCEAESGESRILGVERSPNGQISGLTYRNRI